MPIIDGKVVRARYTSLKLNEISSVDSPAQPGARMVIMKRNDDSDDINSRKREEIMAKTVEQLEGDLAKANDTIKSLEADVAKGKADFAAMSDEKDKLAEECKTAKATLATATDEVITVGGQELRKSVVGEAGFSVAKALRDERDMAQFEKRAETEFGHVVGTAAEKALVLKSLATLPEEAKKAAEAIFTACEKMTAAGFDRTGTGHGAPINVASKAAEGQFMDKVAEVAKRDSLTQTDAMSKARREFPSEYAAFAGN